MMNSCPQDELHPAGDFSTVGMADSEIASAGKGMKRL